MLLVCSIVVNVLAAIVLACIYVKRNVHFYRHDCGWNINYRSLSLSRYVMPPTVEEPAPQLDEAEFSPAQVW